MKALVLAAGLGERVRPLTEKIPKPMLEVGGRPLIHYALTMLRRAGITEVAINVHYLAAAIEKGLGSGAALGLNITYAPEPVLSGTGGPLNGLKDYLAPEPFVIANSDSVLDLDLSAMIAFHRERGAILTLALHGTPSQDALIDSESRVRRMRLLKTRNPPTYDDYPAELSATGALTPYMYCGAIVAEPAVLEMIPPAPPWGLMTGLIAPMVARGLPVFGYVHRGLFRTVNDVASYEALRQEFATNPPRPA